MDLSFLILTSKRPEQFQKCINSCLNIIDMNKHLKFEIIVNNDSIDIEEISNDTKNCNIQYFYKQYELNDLYKFIFDKSTGNYIYYLEDDDILLNSFQSVLDNLYSYQVHVGLYKSFNSKITSQVLMDIVIANQYNTFPKIKYFQLSQMIFKRKEYKFPETFNLLNDEILFQTVYNESESICYYKKLFFQQGIGNDNISLHMLLKQG